MSREKQELINFTIAMSRIDGVGPRNFLTLMEEAGGINPLFELSRDRDKFAKLVNGFDDMWHFFRQQEEQAAEEYQSWGQLGLSSFFVWDEAYPPSLRAISDPPIFFLWRGLDDPRFEVPLISVVGTRGASSLGLKRTHDFVATLVAYGFGIVSGMATGIDTAAHEAAIAAQGYTIAVLAGSAHEPSPRSNHQIYNKILLNGGVISEFPPDTEVQKWNFSRRNRIIAGLTLGTLVVEAGEDSGALITANHAFNYGRQVFALPGDIGAKQSYGCNKIIKENKAKLVQSTADIVNELQGLHVNLPVQRVMQGTVSPEEVKLSGEAKNVYEIVVSGPVSLEEISASIDKSSGDILSLLSLLEVEGLIEQQIDGTYKPI